MASTFDDGETFLLRQLEKILRFQLGNAMKYIRGTYKVPKCNQYSELGEWDASNGNLSRFIVEKRKDRLTFLAEIDFTDDRLLSSHKIFNKIIIAMIE